MTDAASPGDPWEYDQLDYKKIGHAFTNLVQSIDTEKVISIEAGFGRGKTFFRKAWAKQLKAAGELVVEIDVLQSDHSGDPVITLLGALVEALPKAEKSKSEKALYSAKKIGAISARTLARAVLKSGVDEVFSAITDSTIDKLDDFDALDDVIQNVGSEMSKVAGQLISSQMAAERVRKTELPEQIETLRSALVEGSESRRVLVIIDELDRCHPDYAISFLEAAKLIFGQSGFVFCLMVNADYLENLARHRFGDAEEDERYLDKFVDIRLKLDTKPETFKKAVFELACDLPLKIPYGDDEAFSVGRAAELASLLAFECGFSMRKTKRILLKLEVALRCYSDRPLDAPLLVFLAFKEESPGKLDQKYLPRSFLTPQEGVKQMANAESVGFQDENRIDNKLNSLVHDKAPELLNLPADRYDNPDGKNYKPWATAFRTLAPHYIPSHQSVLDGVASVLVSEDSN